MQNIEEVTNEWWSDLPDIETGPRREGDVRGRQSGRRQFNKGGQALSVGLRSEYSKLYLGFDWILPALNVELSTLIALDTLTTLVTTTTPHLVWAFHTVHFIAVPMVGSETAENGGKDITTGR